MTIRHTAMLLIVGALLIGCAGGDDEAKPTTTTRPAARTSTTVTTDPDVIAAYRGFWRAYLAAADPMDPADPDLARYATGASLDRLRASFSDHFAKGEVIRGTVDLAPKIEKSSGVTATLRDCYLDRTHVFDSSTGAQVDQPGDATFEVVATLVLESGSWKVSTLDKVADGCEH
jgi:hypothetical protein